MNAGDYAAIAAIAGQRVEVPWPFRDRLTYKAHVEPGTIRALIAGAPVEAVLMSDLHAIQRTVALDRVVQYIIEPQLSDEAYSESGTPKNLPIVVQFGGRKYIHDGHHRLTRAHLLEWSVVQVRIVDLDAAAAKKSSTKVQTLIFDKKKFTRKRAVSWAKTHDFKSSDVDETEDSYRLRQRDPARFKPGSMKTIKLAGGISAVIGKLK